jgi:hypothetical protein
MLPAWRYRRTRVADLRVGVPWPAERAPGLQFIASFRWVGEASPSLVNNPGAIVDVESDPLTSAIEALIVATKQVASCSGSVPRCRTRTEPETAYSVKGRG